MTVIVLRDRPPGWDLIYQAIEQRKTITARYHRSARLLCPHLLGWRNRRAKLLSYQPTATTATAVLDPRQQWRWMFVDEMEDLAVTDIAWLTATNYSAGIAGIDLIEIAVTFTTRS